MKTIEQLLAQIDSLINELDDRIVEVDSATHDDTPVLTRDQTKTLVNRSNTLATLAGLYGQEL